MRIRVVVETENLGAESFFELKGYYPSISQFQNEFGVHVGNELVKCFIEAYNEVWNGVERQKRDRSKTNGNHL